MSENMQDKLEEIKEKKQTKRKKEDKKYLVIMLIMFVVCGLAGFFTGVLFAKLKKAGFSLTDIPQDVINTLAYVMPIVFIAINIILAIITVACISKAKKKLKAWDGEDEEIAEKIEGRVSIPLCLSSVVNVINMFMFSVCVNLDINSTFSENKEDMLLIANVVVFLLAMAIVIIVQKKTIDFTKDMNPEKEGSVFDAKFSKKWEESCDEAQKLQIYKAGSAGFKAMSSVCMTLWIVCLIADLFGNVGLLPVTMVFIIWLTGIIGYLVGAAKAEKEMNR